MTQQKKERNSYMQAFTDYPLPGLDEPNTAAPIRQVNVTLYDGDKYCWIWYNGNIYSVKKGYLYSKPGRSGEVPLASVEHLTFNLDKAPQGVSREFSHGEFP
jgi:hypothetical protein